MPLNNLTLRNEEHDIPSDNQANQFTTPSAPNSFEDNASPDNTSPEDNFNTLYERIAEDLGLGR